MAYLSATINVMVGAARKAARGLVRDFGEVEQLQVSLKGTNDFVSNADIKAEQTLVRELKKARPGFGFLREEGGAEEGRDPSHRWIIDPLDGTTNFLHGIPHFSISIGLERDGEMIAGVVYNPITDEMFYAEKGLGAFLNDRRLRTSARRRLDETVIVTGIPHLGRPGHGLFLAQVQAVMGATAGVRRTGSAALDLAYVGAGRYDGFWEMNLSAWDVAAGIVIVREAGGFISEVNDGGDMLNTGSILAANSYIHPLLGTLLRDAGLGVEVK